MVKVNVDEKEQDEIKQSEKTSQKSIQPPVNQAVEIKNLDSIYTTYTLSDLDSLRNQSDAQMLSSDRDKTGRGLRNLKRFDLEELDKSLLSDTQTNANNLLMNSEDVQLKEVSAGAYLGLEVNKGLFHDVNAKSYAFNGVNDVFTNKSTLGSHAFNNNSTRIFLRNTTVGDESLSGSRFVEMIQFYQNRKDIPETDVLHIGKNAASGLEYGVFLDVNADENFGLLSKNVVYIGKLGEDPFLGSESVYGSVEAKNIHVPQKEGILLIKNESTLAREYDNKQKNQAYILSTGNIEGTIKIKEALVAPLEKKIQQGVKNISLQPNGRISDLEKSFFNPAPMYKWLRQFADNASEQTRNDWEKTIKKYDS